MPSKALAHCKFKKKLIESGTSINTEEDPLHFMIQLSGGSSLLLFKDNKRENVPMTFSGRNVIAEVPMMCN